MLSPLSYASVELRTRRGIRTPNLPALNRTPLPIGLRGHEWSSAVSNRARKACKAILCTGTYPMEPAGRLERPPAAYETAAPPVVLRWLGAGDAIRMRSSPLYKSGAGPNLLHRRGALGASRTRT